MSIVKKKIKHTSKNENTGEVHEILTTQIEYVYRKPISGYKGVYMKRLSEIVELSKNSQRLFFAVVSNVDDYNRLKTKWNTLLPDCDSSNLSKSKKELIEKDYIAKIGKCYVLNPFVMLPRYQASAPEMQNAIQMIYNRYVHNMNDWYEDIDNDMNILFVQQKNR